MKLLSRSNPKLQKCSEFGYLSAGLMLLPYNLSGAQFCSAATACANSCLNSAGRGGINKLGAWSNDIQEARRARSEYFLHARKEFIEDLKAEIALHARYSEKLGLKPVVRLNTLSDLAWERLDPTIFSDFPFITFYDYTKHSASYRTNLPQNYHLTYSRAETQENQLEAQNWLNSGRPISVVFDTKKGKQLPTSFLGQSVVDADVHDLTFEHAKQGLVLGLRAKGKAIQDTSGFVVRAEKWSFNK